MGRKSNVLVVAASVAVLAGFGLVARSTSINGPSDETTRAIALLSSNLEEEATELLVKRIQSDPSDTSAVFLLKIMRGETNERELLELAEKDGWARSVLAEGVASQIKAATPEEVSFPSFEGTQNKGDALERQPSDYAGGPLSQYIAGFTTPLLPWYLKEFPSTLSDPKQRFACYVRLGYGGEDETARLKAFANGMSGPYLDLAYWETASVLYLTERRDESASLLVQLKQITKSETTKAAAQDQLRAWRTIRYLDVPISTRHDGNRDDRCQEVSLIVKPGTQVEVQVLSTVVVRGWGREVQVHPADDLHIIDVPKHWLDQYWANPDKLTRVFPGKRITIPAGHHPSMSVPCSSGELIFYSSLPRERSEDVWKLRVEYPDSQIVEL